MHKYIVKFSDINNKPSVVQVINTKDNIKKDHFIRIDDNDFLSKRSLSNIDGYVADLIDLAVAIFVVDRIIIPPKNNVRTIHIELPLRCPHIFKTHLNSLKNLLNYYLSEDWSFEFTNRVGIRPSEEIMYLLDVNSHNPHKEVALWSGGLDSLCGLYNRMQANPNKEYVLFGTGSNLMVFGKQLQIAETLKSKFSNIPLKLIQLKIKIYRDEKLTRRNAVPRSRGLVFLLLGTVCMLLENQFSLYVYENGVGAINLPLVNYALSNDFSKAVHPISMCYVQHFVSEICGKSIKIINPFVWQTKAEMCKLIVLNDDINMIAQTITCDRKRRAIPIQCGVCSSCLLRRYSIATHGISDPTGYYIPIKNLRNKVVDPKDKRFLLAMNEQVNRIAQYLSQADPWSALTEEFIDIPPIIRSLNVYEGIEPTQTQENILKLYSNYSKEWNSPHVQNTLKQGLI